MLDQPRGRTRSLSRMSIDGAIGAAMQASRAGRALLAAGQHGIKRYFSVPAAGVGAAAAAAALASGRSAKRAKVESQAGPRFNPGGAGGYRIANKTKKRKPRKKVKISPGMRRALNSLITKKTHQFELMQRTKYSDMLAVYTGNAFPIDNTPSTGTAIANDYVGWYSAYLTDFNLSAIKSKINDAYRRDAYVASGASVVRNVPQGFGGDMEQKTYKLNASYSLRIKNNGSQTAFVDVFEVKCTGLTSISPTGELGARYDEAYVLDTAVIAGTDPQAIQKAFDQGWSTPGYNGQYNMWKKGSSYTLCLNPGDETTLGFKHSFLFSYDNASSTYCKGSYAIMFRVQGSLSHSDADYRAVHFSAASVDVNTKRVFSVYVKEPTFTGQRRITNNAHDAFADDVIAGDATQHAQAN